MQSDEDTSALLKTETTEKNEAEKNDQFKGARPKVRNPKEAKRRRFVMKQAKTISKPQLLESVSETEESQTLLSKPRESQETQQTANKGQEFFGVRSYVHTFYEAMAMDNPQAYEDVGRRFGYTMPIRKRRKQVLCWRVMLFSGIFIMTMGLIAILVGFLVPKRKEVVDTQEDIEIINRADQAFNEDLDICKIVGIVLFCSGGSMITAMLLILILTRRNRIDDPLSAEEVPLTSAEVCQEPGPSTPMDVKVPATEELTAVQPRRTDPEEVVMTNTGLCKIK